MLPADATDAERTLWASVVGAPEEREFWAGLAAIVGICHDGPELGTDRRFFERLEAACRSFGVSAEGFDRLARRFGWHYSRAWDCYLDRETYLEVELREARRASAAIH